MVYAFADVRVAYSIPGYTSAYGVPCDCRNVLRVDLACDCDNIPLEVAYSVALRDTTVSDDSALHGALVSDDNIHRDRMVDDSVQVFYDCSFLHGVACIVLHDGMVLCKTDFPDAPVLDNSVLLVVCNVVRVLYHDLAIYARHDYYSNHDDHVSISPDIPFDWVLRALVHMNTPLILVLAAKKNQPELDIRKH